MTEQERQQVEEIITSLKPSALKYETGRASKKGLSLFDWILEKEQKFAAAKIKPKLDAERAVWKTSHYGTDFFDINYWTKGNKFYKDGSSTLTSKEMMEFFLKTVGGDNPSSYSQKGTHGKTTVYLWFCLERLLGIPIDETSFDGQQLDVWLSDEPFEWFSELEHLITDDTMWWVLMRRVWTLKSHYITEDAFNRYGRMSVSFAERIRWGDYLNSMDGGSIKSKGVLSPAVITDRHEKIPDDETLIIFRSFKVPKGKAIRKNVFKDRPHSHMHDAGSSFSYSFSKAVTVRIANPISTIHYKKYCGMNDDEAEKNIGNWVDEGLLALPTYYEGFFSCIGKFECFKSDIIFCTDDYGEDEVVISPKNVDLIDYRFLNIIDYLATRTHAAFSNSLTKGEEQSGTIKNRDGLYDAIHLAVQKIMTANPDKVGELLKMDSTDAVPSLLREVINTLIETLGYDEEKSKIGIGRASYLGTDFAKVTISNKEIDGRSYEFPRLTNGVRQRKTIPASAHTLSND